MSKQVIPDTDRTEVAIIAAALEISTPLALSIGGSNQEWHSYFEKRLEMFCEAYDTISQKVSAKNRPPGIPSQSD